MAISEKIELLGKGCYTNIPDVLTLKNIPTASELEYVGSEDFDKTMIDTILPYAVEEKVDFNQLLEIDYHWVCRCLRILNFGPYYTTNAIYCTDCKSVSRGEYQVNLNTIDCKPLPEGFVNKIVIKRDEFVDFNGDIEFRLPTIQQTLNSYKDKAFQKATGASNRELARICYMVTSIKGKTNLNPVEIKMLIQKELSAADYKILKQRIDDLSDYGLRAGGSAQCPKCASLSAKFVALTDDRFFRPTLGDLRRWKDDRSKRADEDVSRDTSTNV